MHCATFTVIGRLGLQALTVALAPSFAGAAAFVASSASSAAGDAPHALVFVVEDQDGVLLSDRPGLPGASVLVAAEAPAAPPPAPQPSAPQQLRDVVAQAARAHRLSPALLHAVIAVESGHSATAVSPRGALGLMQLMPATAHAYGVTHPFDPVQNVNAGALHLRRLLDSFGHDLGLALAAYNAGAGAVRRHGGAVPPYPETRAYVPRVLRLMARFGGADGSLH